MFPPLQKNLNTPAKKHELVSILIVAAGMAAVGTTVLFVGVQFATSGCGDGWDGFGCSIGIGMLASLLASIASLVSSMVLLKRLILQRWLDAFLLSLSTTVFLVLLKTFNSLNIITPSAISSYLASAVWLAFLLTIAGALWMLATLPLFRRALRKNKLRGVGLCIGLIATLAVVMPVASNFLIAGQYNSQQLSDTKALSFQLFAPGYHPAGYRTYTAHTTLAYSEGDKPYYQITYLYGNNDLGAPGPFDINEFAVPAIYNPPTDCGDHHPDLAGLGHDVNPCTLVGHSKAGCDIYYSQAPSNDYEDGFCRIGDTLISFSTTRGGPGVSEIIKTLDSLQPSTPEALSKLPK